MPLVNLFRKLLFSLRQEDFFDGLEPTMVSQGSLSSPDRHAGGVDERRRSGCLEAPQKVPCRSENASPPLWSAALAH